MTHAQEPVDSPVDWVAEHTRQYVATDGAEGHLWHGVPTLLLTTMAHYNDSCKNGPLGDDASHGGLAPELLRRGSVRITRANPVRRRSEGI